MGGGTIIVWISDERQIFSLCQDNRLRGPFHEAYYDRFVSDNSRIIAELLLASLCPDQVYNARYFFKLLAAFPLEMCYATLLWLRLISTNHINGPT